ncbi:unnamed protein product [Cuscuta epithymum]|uniref:Reverse transcriptase zinc-binding domain-containing protein n=1 Tax=Cuscuta epithymum TaxID=186058 RepID=A0AAV0DUQ1_9ASTE|nr:unnamed protein product [Cuscuta epithymum]
MVNLRRRRVDCAVKCGLCGAEDESLLHLFVFCPVAAGLLQRGARWAGISKDRRLTPLWVGCREYFPAGKGEELLKVSWGCWGLWSERNRRVWQGGSLGPGQFMRKAGSFVASWRLVQI